jgi:1-phosphatidylinositol-3-phosphate 5-kinase
LSKDTLKIIFAIPDYIKKYTIDKKIESYVKQALDQSKLPTIVSPSLYKTRFSEAMDRYFLAVPDRWEGLSKK